jgi:hypothetical protein
MHRPDHVVEVEGKVELQVLLVTASEEENGSEASFCV